MKKTLFIGGLLPLLTSCEINENGDVEFTLGFWVIVIIVFLSVAILGSRGFQNEEENEKRRSSMKSKVKEMNPSAEVFVRDSKELFLIFDDRKEIMYRNENNRDTIIPFDKIMSVELIENNTIITSKSLGRVVSGALIGDLVAGGAGMIVGGLSGGSKQNKKISKVSVQIKLRDYSKPVFDIVTFDAQRDTGSNEIKPDSTLFGDLYKKALEEAIKITNLIGIIIDKEDNEKLSSKTPSNDSGIVNELQSLISMKEKGFLTDEEFNDLKKKIINKN